MALILKDGAQHYTRYDKAQPALVWSRALSTEEMRRVADGDKPNLVAPDAFVGFVEMRCEREG